MKTMNRSVFCVTAFIFCVMVLLLAHCLAPKKQKNTLTIVATTSIIADTVRQLVGDNVQVYALMGPGVDPHLYRAREGDVHRLAEADIIFYNGLHLEGKMGHVLEGMNRFTRSVAVADGIDKSLLRQADFEGLYDPHIWFDVSLWVAVTRYIADTVIVVDPEHAEYYKMRSDEYIQRLIGLDAYIKQQIATIAPENRILVTAHDAFGYFGRAYGMRVVGLQGLSTDSEISMKDVQELATFIVDNKIRAIFVESSIPQRTLVAVQNAVAARGWSVALGDELYSDALGDPDSLAGTYYDMVKHNVDAIVHGLR